MIIEVIEPNVYELDSKFDRMKALAKCAYNAGISHGRLSDIYFVSDGEGRSEYVGAPHALRTFNGNTVKTFGDAEDLIHRLMSMKPNPHESVLDHGNVSFLFEGSRIYSHEQVRHKIGLGLTQMSTRYIEEKDTIRLIKPPHMPDEDLGTYEFIEKNGGYVYESRMLPDWISVAVNGLVYYMEARKKGVKRESARYNLPHCLATCIGITGNFRAWRNILRQRTPVQAAPEIRTLYQTVYSKLKEISPVLVEDL